MNIKKNARILLDAKAKKITENNNQTISSKISSLK